MSIETNRVAGNSTGSWVVYFAQTAASTPDDGWKLVDPLT